MNTGKAFFSLKKPGDLTIATISIMRVVPSTIKNIKRIPSFCEEIFELREGELRVTVATISLLWFRNGKNIV